MQHGSKIIAALRMVRSHIVRLVWRSVTVSAGIGRGTGSERRKKLPASQVMIKRYGDYVAVSAYEMNGYRDWEKFSLSNLPNNFISKEQLERIVTHGADRGAIQKL